MTTAMTWPKLSKDKPIFLSVGYSTCHWGHVMERESFADPEDAEILHRNFIAIKVDREEHPDASQFEIKRRLISSL
jgi:uncharacterized protein YyaL (SSP411 family)